MSRYEYDFEDDNYIDGEEKRPKLFKILGILMLIIIILILVAACVGKRKSDNTNLSYIRVSDGVVSPLFNTNTTNYEVITEKEEINVFCGTESKKSNVVGCNTKVLLTQDNTEHVIKVTAEDGSVKTFKLLIKKEEKAKELLSVKIISEIESGEEAEDSTELNAQILPYITDVSYEWYKDGKKIDSTENKIVVKESGKYYVKVINNVTKEEVTSNVFTVKIKTKTKEESAKDKMSNSNSEKDKVKYTLSISKVIGNATSWTSSVTLHVEASTSNGLNSKAYSFDGGKTFQAANYKKFTKNQTVKIVVKDIKGNTTSKNIKITKIDNTIPEVKITANNKTNKSVILNAVVTPGTTASGYKYEWYKDGNKISGATKSIYTATETGKYKVKVTTGTNKSAVSKEYSFTVVTIACPKVTAFASSGNEILPKTWFNEVIYVKIDVSDKVYKYDVNLNKYGIFDEVSKDFSYTGTFTQDVKIKIVNNGLRMLKLKVYDKDGNSDICYSDVYYLK